MHLVIPYTPRKAFIPYHQSNKRFGVTVAHRRAGKTVARVNKLIRAAVESNKVNPQFGYLAPYYVQAKDIAWKYLKQYTGPLSPLGLKQNESDLTITFGHNNATIKLYGAENAERMRGLYFDGIVVDEGQGIAPSVLTTVVLPALSDRLGWLDVSGTPKGWANLLGELVKLARENPDEWFLQILKASESGILPPEELARMRKLIPENEYNQEFECDFDAAITGSVYGRWITDAMMQGRIRSGIYDPELDVHTAWDLGYDDATAIWAFQFTGGEIRFIRYFEASGENVAFYCNIIKAWQRDYGYRFGRHWVPHDAANKLLAAGGRSIVQQAYEQGVKMHVVPATTQQNQIEAGRMTLERAWFDPDGCGSGIEFLKQYQFEFDEKLRVFRSKPKHDFTSHCADAFEISSRVWKNPQSEMPPERPKFLNDMTANELFWPAKKVSGFERI